MKILGIDPGTIQLGLGLLEFDGRNVHLRLAETVKTHAKDPLPKRLQELYHALSEVFQIYRPDEVALESVFFSKDVRAAIKIGEARAIAMLVASQFSSPVTEYPPARVKQAVCGNGQARKHQIQFMIRSILKLRTSPPEDAADALALALCHHQNKRFTSYVGAPLVGARAGTGGHKARPYKKGDTSRVPVSRR